MRKIALCESAGRHFDSVYPKPHQYKAAICQSIVYEILYRDVFGFDKEIELSVHLLRSRAFPADSPRSEFGQSAYSMAIESEFESSTEVFGSGGGGNLTKPGKSCCSMIIMEKELRPQGRERDALEEYSETRRPVRLLYKPQLILN